MGPLMLKSQTVSALQGGLIGHVVAPQVRHDTNSLFIQVSRAWCSKISFLFPAPLNRDRSRLFFGVTICQSPSALSACPVMCDLFS